LLYATDGSTAKPRGSTTTTTFSGSLPSGTDSELQSASRAFDYLATHRLPPGCPSRRSKSLPVVPVAHSHFPSRPEWSASHWALCLPTQSRGVGHVGAGKGESFNPAGGSSFIDASRYYNLFDPLSRVSPTLEIEPGLALEWNPNNDSTVDVGNTRMRDVFGVVHLLQGVDDIICGERLAIVPSDIGAQLELPLAGRCQEAQRLNSQDSAQVSECAPVRLLRSAEHSHRPRRGKGLLEARWHRPLHVRVVLCGRASLCKRNPSYWEEGKPYVDEWEDISIDDNAARLNALLAGEIDMMSQLPFAQAKDQQQRGEIQVLAADSPAIQVFIMAVDIAPFEDERVRQAFRLIPDRQALIDGALFGFGSVGNDLAGKGLPFFAEDLPARDQDLEQARSLLRQAGAENLKVTLHTSDIVPGFVEAATLLAQQAKGAGVTIEVKKEPPNAYFDTSLLYTKLDFAQSFWTFSSVPIWYDAQGAPDESTATELWGKIQQTQYEQGGYIVWENQQLVDGASTKVKGLKPSSFFNLGGWNYRDVQLG